MSTEAASVPIPPLSSTPKAANGNEPAIGNSDCEPVFTLKEGALCQLADGQVVDLATAEGVAKAEEALNEIQLTELRALMRKMGFKLTGQVFVPADNYEIRRERNAETGPTDVTAGMSDLDEEMIENVWTHNGFPSPYNANTTEKLGATLAKTEAFPATVDAATRYLANPTKTNASGFLDYMRKVTQQMPFAGARTNQGGNIMEVLFLVFRESIKATNEDKKYFLIKLQEFNRMAEELSDYLSYLVNRSQSISQQIRSNPKADASKITTGVFVVNFDLAGLDSQGNLRTKGGAPPTERLLNKKNRKGQAKHQGLKPGWTGTKKPLDRNGLSDTIKNVESMQETVRNKRQMSSTAFQNFDQKSNQLYNLMASVMKTMNEMRGGTVRNIL